MISRIENQIAGTDPPNLAPSAINRIRVGIPSLPEQRKIADFLTSVDKRIQLLEDKKTALETYKRGVMQKLFSREIRFKDENGQEYPDWQEKRLGDVFRRVTTKNKLNKVSLVLTNSAVHGIIDQSDYFDHAIANEKNLNGYYIVELDDFVYNPRISELAPVGPFNRNKLTIGLISPLYTVFSLVTGLPSYYEFYFQSTFWYRYMNEVGNFGARHDRINVSNVDLENMPIPFPSLPEQRKIADFLSAIDKSIEQVSAQIESSKTFKKGLLQKMFV